MFCAARISPPLESARSPCAAARPLPRSTSEKHFDLDTYTLISASGDSRLYCSHQWFSGSVTARVPIFFSQVGISGCGASARAATAAHPRTRVNAAGTAFVALWCNTDRPSRMELFLFTKVIRVPRQCKPTPPRGEPGWAAGREAVETESCSRESWPRESAPSHCPFLNGSWREGPWQQPSDARHHVSNSTGKHHENRHR